MQILASIPRLATADEPPDELATAPTRAEDMVATEVAPSATDAEAAGRDVPAIGAPAAGLEPAAPAASEERPRAARLPTPSILVLSFLAIAMWVAAVRNDRLRLEAARQARAERMAQVVAEDIGPRGGRIR